MVVHQPEDPIAYFHEELSRIKKEVEENNVSSVPSALSIYMYFIKLLASVCLHCPDEIPHLAQI